MTYQNTSRTMLKDAERLENDRQRGRDTGRRHLLMLKQAREKEIVGMLWCGDDFTGDVQKMTLMELWEKNKSLRQDFINDKTERMYEWRWNKRRHTDGTLRKRSKSTQLAAPIGRRSQTNE